VAFYWNAGLFINKLRREREREESERRERESWRERECTPPVTDRQDGGTDKTGRQAEHTQISSARRVVGALASF
jgi:hypothetical protein